MARARLLKPSFFISSDIGSLKPLARMLFQGLWCISDRTGRLKDDPKWIKTQVLPYDRCNVDALLDDLVTGGLIVRYESGGRRFIEVVNFLRHQTPHVKEPASIIPAPDLPDAKTPVPVPEQNGVGTRVESVAAPAAPVLAARPRVFALYEGMGWTIAPAVISRLEDMESEHPLDWLEDAFRLAAEARARNLNYIEAILKHWREHGRDCECRKPVPRASGQAVSPRNGTADPAAISRRLEERRRAAGV